MHGTDWMHMLMLNVLDRLCGCSEITNHIDRYFLDNVAGWIYELDRGKGQEFEGNYNEWLAAKNARLQVPAPASLLPRQTSTLLHHNQEQYFREHYVVV